MLPAPSAVNNAANLQALESSLLHHVGTLGASLIKGDLHQINFTDIQSTLTEMNDLATGLSATQQSSASGMYQNSSGKWTTALSRISMLFGCAIYGGVATYEEFFSGKKPQDSSTQYITTMFAVGHMALGVINEMCKDYSDQEAKALKQNPPIAATKITATRKILSFFNSIVQEGIQDAPKALAEYQQIYPSLPANIKQLLPSPANWHPEILEKIAAMTSAGNAASSSDTGGGGNATSPTAAPYEARDEAENGEDTEPEHVIVIPSSSNTTHT